MLHLNNNCFQLESFTQVAQILIIAFRVQELSITFVAHREQFHYPKQVK